MLSTTLQRKFALILLAMAFASPAHGLEIHQGKLALQRVLDDAPEHATVLCDETWQQTFSEAVIIRKPLTLRGLNARLQDGLGKTSLLHVASEGVTLLDLKLQGNKETVSQDDREALVQIYRGNFRVERCEFFQGTKDGLMIHPNIPGESVVGGVVRDIVGRGMMRDVISISGDGEGGGKVRNLFVENIRAYDSMLRGAVEVSDGSEDIVVRNVYAENCVYAIDVQDHNKQEVNKDITFSGVHAVNCTYAVRNANRPFGHDNITIINVVADRCALPIELKNTGNYTLRNVRIINQNRKGTIEKRGSIGKATSEIDGLNGILVSNCANVTIENISVEGGEVAGAAVLIENSNNVRISDVEVSGGTYAYGVRFLASKGNLDHLNIHNVSAPGVTGSGILLEKSKDGSLSNYSITNNRATVADRIQGTNALMERNF